MDQFSDVTPWCKKVQSTTMVEMQRRGDDGGIAKRMGDTR